MKFKKIISFSLTFVMALASTTVAFAGTNNTGKETASMTDLKIDVNTKNMKIDPITSLSGSDNKTILHTNLANNAIKNSLLDSTATTTNTAPIAQLKNSVTNPESVTPLSYMTTDTQVLWLWSYNGQNFSYDPDGDAITNVEVGGIPSSAISSVTDQNGNMIGFATKFSTAGNYTMTFRCQDEHGLWSNTWKTSFTVVSAPIFIIPSSCSIPSFTGTNSTEFNIKSGTYTLDVYFCPTTDCTVGVDLLNAIPGGKHQVIATKELTLTGGKWNRYALRVSGLSPSQTYLFHFSTSSGTDVPFKAKVYDGNV